MGLNRRDFLKYSMAASGLVLLSRPTTVQASDSNTGNGMAVLVDSTMCQGCWWCYAACKRSNNLPETPQPEREDPPQLDGRIWTTLGTCRDDDNWQYAKRQCMHCLVPACVTACPVGALQKTEDGPVVYDKGKCIGCRFCMVACPFGVPGFDWEDPLPWIKKCDFCADRQAEGLEPACVAACPWGALKYGERNALIAEAKERIAAAPDKYYNHVYGEYEAGGTSWLYISAVPVEEMGFPKLDDQPVNLNANRAMNAVPPVLLGVAVAMSGISVLTKRRQKKNEVPDEN